MPTYIHRAQLAQVIRSVFGDLGEVAVQTQVAINLAESGADTDNDGIIESCWIEAINDNYPTHQNDPNSVYRYDYGVGQVNSVHGFEPSALLSDVLYNVQAQRTIYDMQGWGAWSTYNGGQWRQHYQEPTPEPVPPTPPNDYVGLRIERQTTSRIVGYDATLGAEVHEIHTIEYIYR